MMANHTSIHSLFDRVLKQYEKLRKRNAFVDNYKKEAMFRDNLEEFDDSKEVVEQLIHEYMAAEQKNYMDYGIDDNNFEDM